MIKGAIRPKDMMGGESHGQAQAAGIFQTVPTRPAGS